MKKTFLVFTLSLVFVFSGMHALNISAGQTITQGFDSIGTSATATLPTDWKADKNSTVRSVGSYSAAASATDYSAGNGMSGTAANGIYNFGAGVAGSATDRAIGGISSGTGSKSVNVYVKLTNNGSTAISSFDISYNVEKYRNGQRVFGIQMYYSTDGENWTSAGNDFLTTFSADANNDGYTSAPGATVSVSNKNLAQLLAVGDDLYLAWNYSVISGSTTTNAQALGIDDISITAVGGGGPQPLLTVSPSTLSDFSYVEGSGPSLAQTFSVSGENLTDDIEIVAPIHFEISEDDEDYTDSITIDKSNGTVDETTIYVRLKAGLDASAYNDEDILVTSTDANNQSVTCSGRVYKTEPSNHVDSFTLGDVTSYSITLNWTDAVGTVVPDAYLIKGSDVGFAEIEDPMDGVTEQWDTLVPYCKPRNADLHFLQS